MNSEHPKHLNDTINKWIAIQKLAGIIFFLIAFILSTPIILFIDKQFNATKNSESSGIPTVSYWRPADINSITEKEKKKNIIYGKQLIAHTSKYFGPKGSIAQTSNGLNCQNCHLQAGTVIFGNNYGSVASLYPKFRARSGAIETIQKRVNDCFERSLNGKALDTLSKEMNAIVAYITFIGSNVSKGKKAEGSGFKELSYLERAADTLKGRTVYEANCKVCHKSKGQGQLNTPGNEFVYPALWGEHSFNDAAGLYRISNIARYVKYNMPQGVTYANPILTDEEAWDVAAFINSQVRPHKATPNDWPDITKKPIDHPFGPYADGFSEEQHKYGPYQEMTKK